MAPTGQYLPPSLLRRVETHIRVMNNPEYFTATKSSGSNNNPLHHQQGTACISPTPSPMENVLIHHPKRIDQPSSSSASPNNGEQQQLDASSHTNNLRPREFSGFSRIHMKSSSSIHNQPFYEEALKKIIPSALAGQSFTVLLAGAPSSGRSQTMYTIDTRRNGGELTLGMVHYIAEDLLKAGPNVRVFVNAYNVRGNSCVDSRTGKAVSIRNYQSPLGPTPETSSILLTKPEDAMIIPAHKKHDGTNFITFEIFHQHNADQDNGAGSTMTDRRGAFSMITLVDVAPFDNPMPSDVSQLRNAVSKQIAGADPHWGSCRLTELLEYSFCRGRTVIGVGTVVGQPTSNFDKTCSVLDFVSLLGNLEQVASIAQFQHPKWLPDLPNKIQQLDLQHEERWKRNYERGVFEVYRKMQDALSAKLREVGKLMEENAEPSERLAKLRQSLRLKLEQALAQIQAAAKDEVEKIDRNLKLAAEKKQAVDKAEAELDHAYSLLLAKKHDVLIKQERADVEQEDVNNKTAGLDGQIRAVQRQNEEYEANFNSDHGEFYNQKKNCVRTYEKIRLHWSRNASGGLLERLAQKKEELNNELKEATAKAVNQDQAQRQERQRKTNGLTPMSLSQNQNQNHQAKHSSSRQGSINSNKNGGGALRRDRSADSVASHYSNQAVPQNNAARPPLGQNNRNSNSNSGSHQKSNNNNNNSDSPLFTCQQKNRRTGNTNQQQIPATATTNVPSPLITTDDDEGSPIGI